MKKEKKCEKYLKNKSEENTVKAKYISTVAGYKHLYLSQPEMQKSEENGWPMWLKRSKLSS
jgi:hypothetical protein